MLELLVLVLSCSPFYICKKREKKEKKEKRKEERIMLLIKMDNLCGDLKPISHKEFNEFIKGKGFKGMNIN